MFRFAIRPLVLRAAAFAALSAVAGLAAGGPVRSVGAMTFAGPRTLMVADWRAGEIHALRLPPAAKAAPKPFNLKNVSARIARALHTRAGALRFEDLAFRPGTELAYISVSVAQRHSAPRPALVAVNAAGRVSVVDLRHTPRSSARIADPPAADKRLWRDIPEAAYTVTDMLFYRGKLYVAGLSNASFASTLRVYDVPFSGHATATSIEMYHAVHNELETRAPIRSMLIATLNGEPTLIAAYTCTPLVTIPLKELKDGAHVRGKTIAELGWGSAPVDMVSFRLSGKPEVLLVNTDKAADLMSVASIADAAAHPGITTPIQWPDKPLLGVKSTYIPIAEVDQLDVQDQRFLGALRRNQESGAMELVSMHIGPFLRLSDFVNEYDFADFKYGPKDPWRGVHRMLRAEEGYPGLAARAAP